MHADTYALLVAACCFSIVLPLERPLEARLSDAIAQGGADSQLKTFCVFGVARRYDAEVKKMDPAPTVDQRRFVAGMGRSRCGYLLAQV